MLFAGFVVLGGWQLQRLAWKTDLIAQVEARVHAAPQPAPGPDAWPTVSRETDQYRRVTARGVFRHDRETLVQAVTDYGSGFWVMTPLQTDTGATILINRGFVTPQRRLQKDRPDGQATGEQQVTGLLRITEPRGGFLRTNDPAGDRWYSRDIAAIAAAKGLSNVAPYFIDAGATPNPDGWPKGGLTIVKFPNSHLVYALTWFGMALLTLVGFWVVAREVRRRRSAR
ncbi:SURF1 family protein [Brevundimonas mediterranea]|uniref:SURF1-like protein n=1 Tax=Brevundimonas mediterranea TaxID=74329 RepID=A0A7W6EYT8_9CAUL|nr:SURF1 family protein [Brevundimonas mediterranea]MBB3871285.1 surfeit locus 1 family protein [Brevundimonas mediterranea]